MQNRYIINYNLEIGIFAKILSRFFNHLSSLATPGGLQTLINEIGIMKLIYAGSIGILLKLIGIKGWFYRTAGFQAKLIDDVSGTLPPYDKSIVLGPNNLNNIISDIYQKTNIKLAVVDVNDLKKVDILGSHKNCDNEFIKKMLVDNPSGNWDEQTPITILRKN